MQSFVTRFVAVAKKNSFVVNALLLLTMGLVLVFMSDTQEGRNTGGILFFLGLLLLAYSLTEQVQTRGKGAPPRRRVSLPGYKHDILIPSPYFVTLLSVMATILVYVFDAPVLQVPSLVLTGVAVVWSGYYIVHEHQERVN